MTSAEYNYNRCMKNDHTVIEKNVVLDYVAELKSNSDKVITSEMIGDLNRIFNYFGGRFNKLEKLYQEAGEYRDIWILRDKSPVLYPEVKTEIADLLSVMLQLLYNEPVLQDELKVVIKKALDKINSGYYVTNKSEDKK